MGKYFGTDGIRGKAFETLNETLAFRVGQGLEQAFALKTVVIGHDTRQSSLMISHMIAAGALSRGLDVVFASLCATPMLAHYAKTHQMIGVMVTASHNPYTDNGIKVFNKGYKSTADEEAIIEAMIDHPLKDIKTFGQFKIADDFITSYLDIYQEFPAFHTHLKVAYDSANGGNYEIAKAIFDRYAIDSIQIGNTPDGLNINVDCGSTHMHNIQNFVKEQQFDIGFSFDGDGDRMLACDQERIYDGDEIILIIASYLKKHDLLKDHHVVLTKMSNPGLLKALRDQGMNYTLTDVGDKFVTETLQKNDYVIGGESSGHIIINRILHTGDGLLAAIYLLYVLSVENKTLKEALANYSKYPFHLENIQNVNKDILKEEETKAFLETIKKELGDDALLLVRPSGTEPLIRVTVSHKDHHIVEEIIHKIVKFIEKRSESHE